MSKLMFTIGEVADLLGITPKTLRHYHKIGLIADPPRDTNNYRRYSIVDIEKIQVILRLKRIGLSLQQIKLILEADDPDALIRTVLKQHENNIRDQIRQLQHHLEDTQRYLESDISLSSDWEPAEPKYSAMRVISDTIKPRSNGLSDILVELEADILSKIDNYPWAKGYELFWHQAGRHLINQLLHEESTMIFWIERYLVLPEMDEDDLQAQAWLREFHQSTTPALFLQTLTPPTTDLFPEKDQQLILKMLPSLLYQQATPLQQQFLQALFSRNSQQNR